MGLEIMNVSTKSRDDDITIDTGYRNHSVLIDEDVYTVKRRRKQKRDYGNGNEWRGSIGHVE